MKTIMIGALFLFCAGVVQAATPEEVIAGFDSRVERMFKAESGKPLVRAKKNPPLKPGRGNYVRGYSYSMVAYAARCLYLNADPYEMRHFPRDDSNAETWDKLEKALDKWFPESHCRVLVKTKNDID